MSQTRPVRVSDVMVTNLHTIEGLATVAEAMAAMRRHQVSSLAVNRRDEDDELGIVTVRDIAREVIARNRAPERVNVYEIMAKPVLAVGDDCPLWPSEMIARYAVRLLVRFAISRALVVDQNRNPLGMVTIRDLVIGLTPS